MKLSTAQTTRQDFLSIVLMGFLVGLIGISIPFIYDDFIRLQFAKEAASNLSVIFDLRIFRPIIRIFFLLNFWLFGPYSFSGHHLLVSLVHGINGGMVYLIGRQLQKKRYLALMAAILFSTFCFNLRSAWFIASAENTLSILFFLASFLFYVLWSKSSRKAPLILLFFSLFLAIMAKPHFIILWLILLSYTVLYRRDLDMSQSRKRMKIILIVFLLSLLGYFVPRMLGVGLSNLRSMYQLTGAYGGYMFKIGYHIIPNFLNFGSRLFLMDKFLNPAMPFGHYFAIGMSVFILFLMLGNVVKAPTLAKKVFILSLLFGLIPVLFFGFLVTTSYLCFTFMIYYFFFGGRYERFSVLWIFVMMIPIFPFPTKYFVAERYLYLPSIGFSFLIISVVTSAVSGMLSSSWFKRRPWLVRNSRVAVPALLIIVYIIGTVTYGYDKFMDTKSIGLVEKAAHEFIYDEVPPDGHITLINELRSLCFSKIQLGNMGREDVKFYSLRIERPERFYFGEGPFIDYRFMRRDRPFVLNYTVEADSDRLIPALRLQLQTYKGIKKVKFQDGDGEGPGVLGPGEKLEGLAIFSKDGHRSVRITCQHMNEGNAVPRVYISGREIDLEGSLLDGSDTVLTGKGFFAVRTNGIRIENGSDKGRVLIKSISVD